MALVLRPFPIDENSTFNCFIVVVSARRQLADGTVQLDNERPQFWFNGQDFARLLNYPYRQSVLIRRVSESNQRIWLRVKEQLVASYSAAQSLYQAISSAFPPDTWSNNTTFVSEAGLGSLVLRSHKPIAQRIFDWIVNDTLPTIRLTIQRHQQQLTIDRFIAQHPTVVCQPRGYLYAATSRSWRERNIFKVASTDSIPIRLAAYDSPDPVYVVFASELLADRHLAERECHALLNAHHYRLKFFRLEEQLLLSLLRLYFAGQLCLRRDE